MSIQNEFASFKLLLKQVYSAHSTKVKELENEIKILKEKLSEKERASNSSLSDCERCIELEKAFISCKKALLDQSKLFENFGEKFSIFNSPRVESKDFSNSNDVARSSNFVQENVKSTWNSKNDATLCDKNELTSMSLGESTITDEKINIAEKISVFNNQNLLKKFMHDDENQSFDMCTVTFPPYLKEGSSTAKFDSLILAPDSLDISLDPKKNCEIESKDISSAECKVKKEMHTNECESNMKSTEGHHKRSKVSCKRLSSDSLDDDRVKRCNIRKQEENSLKLSKAKGVKSCNMITPRIVVTDEASDVFNQASMKTENIVMGLNALSASVPKKKDVIDVVESKDNKNVTPKNLNSLKNNVKNKVTLNEPSPSLLPTNVNAPPKIIDLEDASSDNDDDFQEQVPNSRSVQNEDSWDACDKRKPAKKNRNIKSIKSTSKYKMTLDAPPLNYKKPTYKQTKLSKTLFQAKDNNLCKKSHGESLHPKNVNPIITESDSPSDLQDHFQISTLCDANKSVDIDATFIPENFRIENPHPATSNVKKNAVEKSHLKNGNLFSNISFPEELQSYTKNEDLDVKENEIEYHSSVEDTEMKENMNSFDRLPLPEEPNYKYKNDVVRKKSERRQLNGFDCKECEKYYSELGLSDKEKKERMKKCSRHRGKFTPPSTPDHFWELDFPDTEECKARGYLNKTQKVKLNDICNI